MAKNKEKMNEETDVLSEKQVEIPETVGICKVDEDENIIELHREDFRQGWIFKDWDAFRNRPEDPCYVPKLDYVVYIGNSFLAFCNDQKEIAEELFYSVDRQSPSTLMTDWEMEGEIDVCEKCGKFYFSYHVEKCPYCG